VDIRQTLFSDRNGLVVKILKVQRAQEIINSSAVINVTYKNEPVYIEAVDRGQEMATIHRIGIPDMKESIPVSELMEL
jgi:H-type small acid-soluble spore protein